MLFAAVHESAIGPKRTFLFAPHMSAFGGKADIDELDLTPPGGHEKNIGDQYCGAPLDPILLKGQKKTCRSRKKGLP
jgi:hypothetical protein